MPTYQYACTACGQPHEQVQSFTDAPLTECPACGGRLRKVFSAVGVVFKGSGFYKTDSRTAAAGGKADKADKNGEKSGDTSGDDKAPKSDKPGTDKSSDKTPAPAKSGDKAPAAAGSGRTGGGKESSRPSSTSSTP